MKEVILITTTFPYFPGEAAFLGTEIKYYKNAKFTIMPAHFTKEQIAINPAIKVDNYLNNNLKNKNKYTSLYLFTKSIFSKIFYKEILSHNLLNIHRLKTFIASIVKYKFYFELLDQYLKNKNDLENTVIYTYWNNEITYALQDLKTKYNYKLVSRIHGFDIYQERRKLNYMPLKAQFTKNIDKIYTITETANDYLHNIYGFQYKTLELSRLGVEDHHIISKSTDNNILHLVSCSDCLKVKQIHKIIEALSVISQKAPNINFIWSHIGDGELYETLNKSANKKLNHLKNINFEFKGFMKNKEVFEFYKNTKVDLFINVSESEGVPVSIMEAMSCSIPIVAPNIGGVSDMVLNNKNGYLLSKESEILEIVDVLIDVPFYKNKNVRNKSYEIFLEKYHSTKNYEIFLDKILHV